MAVPASPYKLRFLIVPPCRCLYLHNGKRHEKLTNGRYFAAGIRSGGEPAPRSRSSPAHCATNVVPCLTRATTVNDPLDATATSWNSHAAEGFSRYETTTRSPPRACDSLPCTRTSTPFL